MSKFTGDKLSSGERKRKTLSMEEKLEIIKLFEKKERTCDIVRITGIKESTLRSIRDNAAKIKKTCLSGTTAITAKCIRARPKEIEKMEHLLSVWMQEQADQQIGQNFFTIKLKALEIYEDIKQKSEYPAAVSPFSASSGWFNGFKNRYGFQNMKLFGEASSVNEDAAKAFLPLVRTLIAEEGYTLDQIFNFDETGLYWKRMPSRTFISKEEALGPGPKFAKDRVTVMLGANASGDFKLKPTVVYHSDNPQALKGIVKSSLGVYFRSSKRGWMTGQIFTDLLADVYQEDFNNYCKAKNIPFKILVILDNAPSHPPTVAELSPHIKVFFLPPNTASLLQPLNQGVESTFKAYYLLRTFKMLIAATKGDNNKSVLEFWKRFNLKLSIDIIVEAWNDVSKYCLYSAWRKLLPESISDFKGFEPSSEIRAVKSSCVELAREVGFEGVNSGDIEELLQSHSEDLSTQDLQQLVAFAQMEDRDDGGDQNDEVKSAAPRELNTGQLYSALSVIEKQLQWIEDNDYNAERSRITLQGIRSHLEPYKQLLFERRKMAKRQKLDTFSQPMPANEMQSNIHQSATSSFTVFQIKSEPSSPQDDDDDDISVSF